jgi:uncharacterized membrane protein
LSKVKEIFKNAIQGKYLKFRKILRAISTLIVLLYPLLIYFGMAVYSSRIIACLIGISLIGNFLMQNWRMYQTRFVVPFFAIIVIYMMGTLLNSLTYMLYLPFFVSTIFLISFSYSLLSPPNTIEVFARRFVSDLSIEETAYCRHVTLIWVCFLGLNGVAAYYTACCASLRLWSLYNGFITYMMLGLLFAVELSYRSWRFRRYAGLPTDFIFKKLFPPKA